MKKKKKNVLIFILCLFVLVILFSFFNNKSIKKVKTDKKLFNVPVTYVVMDSNVPDNIEIKNATTKYKNNMLTFIPNVGIELIENGNYFVGKLVNSEINNNIVAFSFTKNNLNAEIVNDCIFDKKNKTIKIPKKYYKKNSKRSEIQIEFITKTQNKKIKRTKISINQKYKLKKQVSVSGIDNITKFSIKANKYITKSNLTLFINDNYVCLDDSQYEYDPITRTISILLSPLTIKNVEVIVNRNIFSNLFVKNASAVSYNKMRAAGKLTAKPGLKNGDTFTITEVPVAYDASAGDTVTISHYDDADDTALYYECDKGNCTNYTGTSLYFTFHMNAGKTDKLSFENGTYVKMYCSDHKSIADSKANPKMNLSVTVLSITDSYIILSFTGTSNFYTQVPAGVLKFVWDNNFGKIIAKKYLYNNGVRDQETTKNSEEFGFSIYDSLSDCQSDSDRLKKEKYTDQYSNVAFKKLEFGTYYVRETKCNSSKYACDTSCHGVTLNANDAVYDDKGNITGYEESVTLRYNLDAAGNVLDANDPIKNYFRYYCFTVRKNSTIANSDVSNISFQSSADQVNILQTLTTTSLSSSVTFGPYLWGTYYYRESSDNSTHWNDNSGWKTASLYEASYSGTGYSGAYCPAGAASDVTDTHKKWCIKVAKKDKATKKIITDKTATFRLCADSQCNVVLGTSRTKAGIATFMGLTHDGTSNTGGTPYYVQEIDPPVGYAIGDPNPQLVSNVALLAEQNTDSTDPNSCTSDPNAASFYNPELIINWYKTTEDKKTMANGAVFKVKNKDTKKYITVSNPEAQTDDSNPTITKTCYKYTGTGTDQQASGTAMVSMNTRTTINGVASDTNGEVCVSGLPKGNYTVEEFHPAQYHTFGSENELSKNVETLTTFKAMDDTNKFINYPTRFEFGKNIVSSYSSTDEGSYKDLTTSELRKLKFNVTDVSGQIVRFKKKRDANNNVIEGEYEYLNNTIDPQGEEEVTDLQLNSDRKIIIWHLPWADSKSTNGAKYNIKEKREDGCTDQNQNTCNGNGFYYPEYNNDSDTEFIIYQTSSPQSKNKIESKQSLSNTPTEIKFTKDDIYCKDSNCNSNYQNGTNGTTQDSVFENEEEIKVFDDIQFVLRDSTGRDVTDHLIKVSDNEYRFVKDVNTLSDELKAKLVKTDSSVVGNNLHTKDGTLKITHLCRESTYYIEEYKVPEHTVFILPTTIKFDGTVPANWNWQGHPYVTYKVSDKESTKKTSPYSDTQVIDNTPTRVIIYKKDSKYDYLIPDETTTFQLYRCKKGEECHPTDDPDNTENYERVRFWNKALIPGDKEDYKNDKTGLQTEVYKFVSTSDEKSMSESDLKSKTTYDLHPDHGVLVFRYLPANYNYVLVETVAPKNYQLPVGRNAETSFKVVDNTVQVDEKDLPNKPTSVLIKKYADDGKLLKGAEFKIYEVEDSNVCSKNLSPVNQKKKLLKLKTIRDGVYEARPEGDTDTIVTCSDRDDAKCSDIKTFVSKELTTKLTHDKYEDSWSKFEDESTSTEDGRQIELQEGVALIQYLEYDHCYVIEETKAPEGYSLPELKKRYTTVTIKKNDEYAHDTNKDLINKPTPFKFYKYDEFNKLIDGAEFKLQKLDDNKKYQDVTVTEIPSENEELYYKVDKDTDNTLIKTKGGTATIYYLTAGQYRVVETKAPGNKVLSKNLNLATFFVDENGSVYGNSIIVNRSIVKTPVKNSASAELIVTIQTGQTVIRYGIIIAVLVGMISGLMILKEKKSRKDYNKDEK